MNPEEQQLFRRSRLWRGATVRIVRVCAKRKRNQCVYRHRCADGQLRFGRKGRDEVPGVSRSGWARHRPRPLPRRRRASLRAVQPAPLQNSVFPVPGPCGLRGRHGSDADITGLQTAANLVEKTLTQANKVKGSNTLQAFVELIDGIHAIGPGDLRIVSSVGVNMLWVTTIANSAAENQAQAQFLMASRINWSTRGNIDDATTINKFGAFIGHGRGIDGAGVAAVWDAGELIRGPYSNAAKGEVVLTLTRLVAYATEAVQKHAPDAPDSVYNEAALRVELAHRYGRYGYRRIAALLARRRLAGQRQLGRAPVAAGGEGLTCLESNPNGAVCGSTTVPVSGCVSSGRGGSLPVKSSPAVGFHSGRATPSLSGTPPLHLRHMPSSNQDHS